MTPRTPIWKAIATSLRSDIAEGLYVAGDKLPTEAVLATRFDVNRHTVRHALAALADESIVHARRGSGVFVTTTPTDYPIGRRVRFHQNLRAAGRTPARKILLLETRTAHGSEADALKLERGVQVHVYEGLSLSEGRPIALFRSVFPAMRFTNLLIHLAADPSITTMLRQFGVLDYTRASTRVNAKLATATQALHLQIAEHAPVLRTIGLNVDTHDVPIEIGRTWFAGDKVTLTLADV